MSGTIVWRQRGAQLPWIVMAADEFHARHHREASIAVGFPDRATALAWVEKQGDRWLEEQGIDVAALRAAGESKHGD